MRRRIFKHRSNSQPGAPVAKQYNGYNAANAMNFTSFPNAATRVLELKAGNPNLVLRFPGGTSGNYTHPTGNGYGIVPAEIVNAPASIAAIQATDNSYAGNHLARQVAFAQATGASVLWMANMYTGTAAEAVTSVQAFLTAGVEVVGIELGNEWYLSRYNDKYATHANYIADALTFRNAMKAAFPTIPVGIIIAPSATMKDKDSGPNQNTRLADANAAIRLLSWPDAYVLHAYAQVDTDATPYNSPGADNTCADHRVALRNHIATFPGKPIWLTEWNVVDTAAGDTDTQADHHTAMRAYIKGEPRITIQTMHSLIASGVGYNAIKGLAGGCTMNRLGNLGKTA